MAAVATPTRPTSAEEEVMSPEIMSPEREEKMRRFTMYKRPASNKVVTADKGESSPLYYLCVEPKISGYLYKNNRRGKWQKRWCEIRGPFLMYWPTKPKTKPGQAPKAPDAAIDIRRTSPTVKVMGRQEICLTSSSRVTKIKVDDATPAQGWLDVLAAIPRDAPVESKYKYRAKTLSKDSTGSSTEAVPAPPSVPPPASPAPTINPLRPMSPVQRASVDLVGGTPAVAAPPPPADAPPAREADVARCGAVFLDSLYANAVAAASRAQAATPDAATDAVGEASIVTFVDPVEFWPEQLSLGVTVAEPEGTHPVYAATVEIAGVGREDSGCAHRFFAWRQLKNDLLSLGMDSAIVDDGFPRTYIRNSFGIRLNEDQQSGRAASLDAWLKRMVESPDLPQEAAVRLAMFLNVGYTEKVHSDEDEAKDDEAKDDEAKDEEPTDPTGPTEPVNAAEGEDPAQQ